MADENDDSTVSGRGINANSILILILMGISSWVLITSVGTGKDVVTIKTAQDFFKSTLDEVKTKMVTKPELDNEVIKMQLKQSEFENRILRTINDPRNHIIATPGAHDDN